MKLTAVLGELGIKSHINLEVFKQQAKMYINTIITIQPK